MEAPLYRMYIDRLGELHIVTLNSNYWDGQAFFLGYATVNVVNPAGDEISPAEHTKRLSLARS